MTKPSLALQLWSVRDDFHKDFASTAAAVASIGYPAVELAGFGNLDARRAKTALDDAGLQVAGLHIGLPVLQSNLNQAIDDALTLCSRHIVCPHWPATHYVNVAACERIGEELNAIGARLRAFELQLSFHNHAAEAKLIKGKSVFDWMLGAAEPRNLAAEPDVYWLLKGGLSPGAFLRRHGSRCPLVHLKDEKEIGGGPVDFDEVFAAVDSIGTVEWLVVEQEWYDRPPLESVGRCFEQLRRWGRA